MDLFLYTLLTLAVIGLMALLFGGGSETLPIQNPREIPYLRPTKGIPKKGLIVGLGILGLAYWLGSKKGGNN